MGKSIKKLTVHIRSEAACQERTWSCLVLGDAAWIAGRRRGDWR